MSDGMWDDRAIRVGVLITALFSALFLLFDPKSPVFHLFLAAVVAVSAIFLLKEFDWITETSSFLELFPELQSEGINVARMTMASAFVIVLTFYLMSVSWPIEDKSSSDFSNVNSVLVSRPTSGYIVPLGLKAPPSLVHLLSGKTGIQPPHKPKTPKKTSLSAYNLPSLPPRMDTTLFTGMSTRVLEQLVKDRSAKLDLEYRAYWYGPDKDADSKKNSRIQAEIDEAYRLQSQLQTEEWERVKGTVADDTALRDECEKRVLSSPELSSSCQALRQSLAGFYDIQYGNETRQKH